MPELPDLQVFSSNLNKKLKNRKVIKLRVLQKRKLKVTERAIRKAIEGAGIEKIYREGKEIHIRFDNETVLGLHLMLHGNLVLFQKQNENKHTIIELHFDDGKGLALTDYQKAATPTLNPAKPEAPDALSKEMNAAYFTPLLAKKKTTIKAFLLDQKMVRGIGNAYADEILWEARISPFSVCNRLPGNKIKRLVKTIPRVLKDAEKKIRKKNPGTISGEERDFLKIHNSRKKESPTGGKIRSATLNSRVTYFTGEQKLFS